MNKLQYYGSEDKTLEVEIKSEFIHEEIIIKDENVDISNLITTKAQNRTRKKATLTAQRAICDICNKSFVSIYSLRTHTRMHLNVKDFHCKFCPKTFTWSGDLVHHENTHTGIKPHHCPYCNYSSIQKTQLTTHLRVHTGEKPYKCKFCDKSFAQGSSCTSHEKLHSVGNPIPCTVCSKKFKDNYNLRRHIRRQHQEKFECKYCKKNFSRTDRLKIHENLHTGEIIYKCRFCDVIFNEKLTLLRHEKSKHNTT